MNEENPESEEPDITKASTFDKMAMTREYEMKELTDEDVWISNITSIMALEIDFETKAQMIVGSVADTRVVFAQLEKHHEDGKLTEEEFNQIFEACIEQFEIAGVALEF
ncbi:MAG: hypothetical protein ACW98K_01940 [Candidatus Kariarchaeaceae archaeon]|jgi:CO/xanthine dehydrogenase FAD-binding subunit